MTLRNSAALGAFALGLAASPALADLTAEQVWSSWKSIAESAGRTITGTETRSGSRLTVSDITMTSDSPQGARVTGRLGDVAFDERGDGTVAVDMPETYPIAVTTTSDAGETVEMDITVRQSGMSMIAKGDAANTTYDVDAPEMTVALDSLTVDGKPLDMSASAVLRQLAGSYAVSQGAPRRIDSDFRVESARIDMNGTSPENGSTVAIEGSARNLVSTSVSTLPEGTDTSDLGKMLESGFSSKGSLGYVDMSYAMNANDSGDAVTVSTTSDSGSLDFTLADGGMVYDVRNSGTEVVLKGSQIPFPQLDVSFEDSAVRFQLPLVQTEAPTDFGLLTRITGLKISNDIWAMFDPAGQLPRDPATLVLDLSGKGRWLTDITDPNAMQTEQTPGELEALNVKQLELSLAGAELTGQGDFTFDNSKAATLGAAPMPAGTMSLKLVGGNALLDKLVGMGLIPQEQATGFRMMLGLFARPGEGADTLVSDIKLTEDGQVLANGQRLR
jgi:hypothetical protein